MLNLEALNRKTEALRGLPSPAMRRAIREAAGASQEDVGQAVGVHRETVSRWERGLRRPRGEQLVSYVELLDRLRENGQ